MRKEMYSSRKFIGLFMFVFTDLKCHKNKMRQKQIQYTFIIRIFIK